jgi:hypothetical protein
VRVDLVLLMVHYRNRGVDLMPMLVDTRTRPYSVVLVFVRVDLVLLMVHSRSREIDLVPMLVDFRRRALI